MWAAPTKQLDGCGTAWRLTAASIRGDTGAVVLQSRDLPDTPEVALHLYWNSMGSQLPPAGTLGLQVGVQRPASGISAGRM
jgi:hypothetical protein